MAAAIRIVGPRFLTCNFVPTSAVNPQLQRTRKFQTLSTCSRFAWKRYGGGNAKDIVKHTSKGCFKPSAVDPGARLCWEQSLRPLSTSASKSNTSFRNTHCVTDLGLIKVSYGKTPLLNSVTNHRHGLLLRRYISSSRKSSEGDDESKLEREDAAWTLRTSVENVYLSWIRNTYIMTVAAVTMYTQFMVPYAQVAADVLLMAGAINLNVGTVLYIYSVFSRRRRMMMSTEASLLLSSLALLHSVMWLVAILVYRDVGEEDLTPEEELQREEEAQAAERKNRLRSFKRISDKYD